MVAKRVIYSCQLFPQSNTPASSTVWCTFLGLEIAKITLHCSANLAIMYKYSCVKVCGWELNYLKF